ncbi:MAG: hypothetical protein NTY19_50760 [Planctomycetota bacterium]|nr:hypothetical protein [Planctomycetota bacterium]
MMKSVHQSQPQITRRAALAASGAGVAAVWLPESVRGQQETPSETDLRRILSGMTLADKVGQLLMASPHHQRRNGAARQGLRPPPEGCGG